MSTKILVSNGSTPTTIAYSTPKRGTCGSRMRRNHLEFFYGAFLEHADGEASAINFMTGANFDRLDPMQLEAEMKDAAKLCKVKRAWTSARVRRFFSVEQVTKWIDEVIAVEVAKGAVEKKAA